MKKSPLFLLSLLICFAIAFSAFGCSHKTAQTCAQHTDADSSGFCDICEVSVTVTVDFYAVNDLHGKLCDTHIQPGTDELTAYLKTVRSADDHSVLLSSGDMWQGSSESNLTRGAIVTDWMNTLGFASMTLGNHEFDWGEEYIEQNHELAKFPYLAINVYERSTDTPVDYCAPSTTVTCGEATVGIIGAVGDCYSSISPEKVEDVYFKTGSELTALIKNEAKRLRSEGADFIVLSIHDGYAGDATGSPMATDSMLSDYYDVTLSDGYVDLVFEAHTHYYYVKQDKHGVYHLQGGGENEGITHVEVDVNFAGGDSTVSKAEYVGAGTYKTFPSDSLVNDLMQKYESQVSAGTKVLGNNSVWRSSQEIRSIIAKLYYEKGVEVWGKDYDVVLGGGFLYIRSPYNLNSGEIRYAELQSLIPFDNRIQLCSIKGSDLKSKFFEATNSNYFVHCGEYGESVRRNLDPSATYYVIVDSYTATYAPNRLTVVATLDDSTFARDLLAEYIENGGLE